MTGGIATPSAVLITSFAFAAPMKAMNRPMPAPIARRRSRGIAAITWSPTDCNVEPSELPIGYCRAAEKMGALLLPHTPAVGFAIGAQGIEGVRTPHGTIATRVVVSRHHVVNRALLAARAREPERERARPGVELEHARARERAELGAQALGDERVGARGLRPVKLRERSR